MDSRPHVFDERLKTVKVTEPDQRDVVVTLKGSALGSEDMVARAKKIKSKRK